VLLLVLQTWFAKEQNSAFVKARLNPNSTDNLFPFLFHRRSSQVRAQAQVAAFNNGGRCEKCLLSLVKRL
jgi:hypothetical protein